MFRASTRTHHSAPPATRKPWAPVIAVLVAALVAALALGCADGAAPSLGFLLRTEVSPQTLTAGDTLTLRAIATNPGKRVIKVGRGCGAALFFEIRTPNGGVIYPYPPVLVGTCEFVDAHALDPGETDTVSFRWVAAVEPGQYSVRSGLPAPGGGLEFLTKPASMQVR